MLNQKELIKGIQTFASGCFIFLVSALGFGITSSIFLHHIKKTFHLRYPYPFYVKESFIIFISITLAGFIASFTATLYYKKRGLLWGLMFGLIAAFFTFLLTISFGSLKHIFAYDYLFFMAITLLAALGGGVLGEKLTQPVENPPIQSEQEQSSPDLINQIKSLEERIAAIEKKGYSQPTEPGSYPADKIINLEKKIESLELKLNNIQSKKQEPITYTQKQPPASKPLSYSPPQQVIRPKTVSPSSKPLSENSNLSFENILTGKWFSRIGIITLILGMSFFLKYAIDNNWIGPMGRVMLGVISGVVLVFLGDHCQTKGYKSYGQSLTGGGIAILYLSFYAAFNFYHLIPQIPAFLAMILITVTGGIFAIKYSSQIILFFAAIGGFLTPALISTGVVREIPLFTYLVILNLGIFWISRFHNWRHINIFSFAVTQIWLQGYLATKFKIDLLSTMFLFTSIYFFIFLSVNIFYNIKQRIHSNYTDLILLLGNGSIYFATVYYKLLEPGRFAYLESFFAVLLAIMYFSAAKITLSINKNDKYLVLSQLGLALTFITIAIPVAFDWHWVTMGWAVEAFILLWIGFKLKDSLTRKIAFSLFIIVGFRLLAFDTPLHETFRLIFTKRTVSFAFSLSLLYAAINRYQSGKSEIEENESWHPVFLAVMWNLLILWWLSAESTSFWKWIYAKGAFTGKLHETIQVSYSVIWTIYSFIIIGIGIWKRSAYIRNLALVIFMVTIAKTFLIDLAVLSLGLRIISFMSLGCILLLVSYFYQKTIKNKGIL